MKPLIEIIIPSFNNWEYLGPCLQSILLHRTTPGLAHVTVINNGHPNSVPPSVCNENPEVSVLQPGKNLGWEGGLKLGVANSTAPFIVFMNDDTYIPVSSAGWLYQMINNFSDPKVAAVGPSSNCVMGMQNIFIPTTQQTVAPVSFLIGYCMMVRRSALEEVGGVDDELPYHGDDLDLSIRFKKAGYKMLCDKNVFVFHHGFKTGQREFGAAWNSVEMTEKTNHHLIKKHGLKEFWTCMTGATEKPLVLQHLPDSEGEVVKKYATGDILELGCGDKKTIEPCVGVDMIPKGQEIPGLINKISVADIVADAQDTLPVSEHSFDTIVARHLFEHIVDPVRVVRDWGRVVRPGGRVILAVPDQGKRSTIPMNFQHVHAYTMDSLKNFMESQGWHTEAIEDSSNEVSFVGVFTKNGVSNGH